MREGAPVLIGKARHREQERTTNPEISSDPLQKVTSYDVHASPVTCFSYQKGMFRAQNGTQRDLKSKINHQTYPIHLQPFQIRGILISN
jgi:hypothetical protein